MIVLFPAPALAIAFAAFCVWLGVRIVNRRERWAKRTAAVVALALVYPISFGPAGWITGHLGHGADIVSCVYRPMTWGMTLSYNKSRLDYAITKFAELGAPYGWKWRRSVYGDGTIGKWHWCG